MSKKTQAMRLLESRNVAFEVYTYPATERDAEKIATLIGAKSSEVYKTLVVVRTKGKPMLVMIPAESQLDLKKLAKEVGEKKVKMASHSEAESLTGLQVGGISALMLLNRSFDIYLDCKAEELNKIFISAGAKGFQILLDVSDLIDLAGSHLVDVTD